MCVYAAEAHKVSFIFCFHPRQNLHKNQSSRLLAICMQTRWYFHIKPEKAVKKTMERIDVECAGLNLDGVFFPFQILLVCLEVLDAKILKRLSGMGQKKTLTVPSGLCFQGES